MIMEWISFIRYFLSTTTSIQENHSSCMSSGLSVGVNTFRKSLQTTSALSTTSKQPAASCLVCSLIFIEFHSTVTYGQMLILLFFYAISNFNWPALTPILSVLPATKSPLRRSSANLSSTSVCRVLRSGRAPISGSYP
ncbi:Uncharacterised protein [Streptococcus pneumoniae]|nr:Uncharacterised protein [Streptococcus pneumoniae]